MEDRGGFAKPMVIDIKNIIRLQTLLWNAFADHHGVSDSSSLLGAPESGELTVENETWLFAIDGLGVMLANQFSGARIDVPRALEGAHIVDTWGLATYFGWLGKTGEKFLFSEIATRAGPVEDRVELWIQKLVQGGILVVLSVNYIAPSCCLT